MKAFLSFLLLAALTREGPALFSKRYIHVNKSFNWTEAQEYCRRNYVDLATISDQQDLHRFQVDVQTLALSWINLSMDSGTEVSIYWSNESISQIMDSITAGDDCVYVQYHFWGYLPCETRLNFICNTWEPKLIVVQEPKTWDEALKYCRTKYTDLVSLNMETDYLTVNSKIRPIQMLRFWISLRFLDGSWFWVNLKLTLNQSLNSLSSCPASRFRCGSLQKAKVDFLDSSNCEEKLNFLCYKENRAQTPPHTPEA